MRVCPEHNLLLRATLVFLTTVCLFAAAGCGTSTMRQTSTPPTATVGNITLATDFAVYNSAQAIGVVVRNSSGSLYFATDSHSACTILSLQQLMGGQWAAVMPCDAGSAVHVLLVAAHSAVPYTLAPGNAKGNPNAWDPGTYRIALLYGIKSDGSDATAHAVYSSGFTVTA